MKLVVDPISGMPTFVNEDIQVHSQSGGGHGSSGTGVQSVVAGSNVTVNNADPLNPIVSASISGGGGTGDVVGPGSSTDNAITRYDGTTGKLLQNSTNATVDDSGNASLNGLLVPAGTHDVKLYGNSLPMVWVRQGFDRVGFGINGTSETVDADFDSNLDSRFRRVLALGDGTPDSNKIFNLDKTVTTTASDVYGFNVIMRENAAGANTNTVFGGFINAQTKGGNSQDLTNLRGAKFLAEHNGTGTITNSYGVEAEVTKTGAGTITTAIGLSVSNITAGTTNYAIKTNTGLVQFGDDTQVTAPGTNGNSVVTNSGSQTLTNKTLTTPTIGSFTNATHGHTNAASGGQLTATTALNATGTPSSTTYLRGDNTWATVSGGGTGITRSINSISAPATAGAVASTDYVYFVSGTTTLTLPTAVGNTNQYVVKNTGSGVVTIATTSAQTIDGSSTASLPEQYSAVTLYSDNSNWFVT